MGQTKQDPATTQLYERLLQRLTNALDEAENLAAVAKRPQPDLELRNVTPSEMHLIRAYLERERERLSALLLSNEQALIASRQISLPLQHSSRRVAKAVAEPEVRACPVCGATRSWQPSSGVQLCQGCGSQLFKQLDHR